VIHFGAINDFTTRVAPLVLLMEQELFTLPEHPSWY